MVVPNEYLTKPFSKDSLLKAVENHLPERGMAPRRNTA